MARASRRTMRWRALLPAVLLLSCLGDPKPGSTLRVVTFNMAMGHGLDAIPGSSFSEAFLERRDLRQADVIALQEVCLNEPGQLERFLDIMRRSHGEAHPYADRAGGERGEGCDRGQATISRFSIQDSGTLQLPRVGLERSAIWTDLRLDSGAILRIYNLHLSNRNGADMAPIEGRLRQITPVLEHSAELASSRPRAPSLIVGDFNSLSSLVDPWRRELALQQTRLSHEPTIERFVPTMVLPYQVDWIFYRGVTLQRSDVVRIFHSDHFPVMADFELP